MKHKKWPAPSTSLVPASEDSPPIEQIVPEDQPADSKPIQVEPKIETQKVKITGSSLNVRKGPGKELYPILFTLKKNNVVDVLNDEDENWLYIKDSEGRTGYVMKVFTAPAE